jgi:tetratricopeptide (TPR) repeat protein
LVFKFYFFLFALFFLLPRISKASESSFTVDSMTVLWEKFAFISEESKNTIAIKVLHSSDSLFVETIEKKIQIAQNKNNTADLLKSYLLLGNFYALDYQYSFALANFEKAKLYASTIEQNVQILLAIARVKIDASLFMEALEYLRQAKTAIYKKDCFDLQAEILIEEGYCYTQLNNFSAAEARYSTALSITELDNLPGLQAKLFCFQGFNYQQQNDYINAMACLVRSIDLNKMDSINPTHAFALNLVGSIYTQQENTAKALNYFLLSQSIYQQLNNLNGIAEIQLEIGLLYLRDSNSLKSLSFLNNALKNYERIENQVGICKANNALADYYIKNNQLHLVPNHLWRANTADQYLNDHRLFFLTTFHFAKYYLACSKYDSALYYANKTFEYNKGNSDIDLLIITHEILSDIYSATGDYKKSMASLKTAQKM